MAQSPADSAADVPHWRFDPLDADYVQNPYPFLAALQDNDPVHRGKHGAWVLTRYADVESALADECLGNSPSPYAVVNGRNRQKYLCAQVANNIMPFMDAPAHNATRRDLARAFMRFMREVRMELDSVADAQLSAALHQEHLDLLDDFATPYAVRVIARVLGVPESDEAKLKSWSEWFFYLFSIIPSSSVLDELESNLRNFRNYFESLVGDRRGAPQQDLPSLLLAAGMDEQRVVDHCMLLFADGVENVDSGIANAVHALLTHPDQWTLLCREPQRVEAAVEECLRFEAPGQFIGRIARQDTTLHGVQIAKDSALLLVIGAANRDPRHFDAPHVLDITRQPNPQLSFGRGTHACIGASLVRQEMASVLRLLIERAPELQLADSARWEARLGHRWIANLPVTGYSTAAA